MSRTHRLADRREFVRFFTGSETFRFRECIIYRISNETGHFRMGITIKAKPRSTERMALKRLLREWMRKHADLLGSFDYNIVVPSRFEISYQYRNALKDRLDREFSVELKKRANREAAE